MKKKLLLAALLLAAGIGSVFAQDGGRKGSRDRRRNQPPPREQEQRQSVPAQDAAQPKSQGAHGGGVGGYFGYHFAGYTDDPLKAANAKLGGVDFGVIADAKYADLLFGLNWDYRGADGQSTDIEIIHGVIGVMGKFPIGIGPRLRVAPTAGFEYQFVLLYNGWARDDVEKLAALLGAQANPDSTTYAFLNLDNIVLKFGVSADYLLAKRLFVRVDLLGTYQFAHNDDVKDDAAFGTDFRLAAGRKF
ncbi:MAG: hypothetical protein MdMp014T_0428 [Treponematales bacterium]